VTFISIKILRNLFAVGLLLLVTVAPWCPAQAESKAGPIRLLIVHAYSQNYPWTAGQHDGFVEGLNQSLDSPVIAKSEYLDTKRKTLDGPYGDEFIQFVRAKYADFAPDAIYVTDDNGLIFAVERLMSVFSGVPVFFSGVNDLTQLDRLDFNKVTGVFEKKEIGPNLELLKHLLGDANEIMVVGDASPTYQAIESELKRELKAHVGLKVHFISDNRIDVVRDAIGKLNNPRILLTTLGAMRDKSGAVLPLAETIKQIVDQRPEVVVSMEDGYLLDGVLGGYVTSSTAQGRAAAKLVSAYFSGTPINELRSITKSPNEYILNDRVLEKIDVELPENIAAKARVINRRAGFFERYRDFIIGAIGLLITALAATLILYAQTMRFKNRQLVNSAEQIQERDRKLEISESRYRTLFEMSEDPMWVIIGERFMIANEAAANELGYASIDELVNIHPSELSPPMQPDGKTSFDKANEMMSTAYKAGFHRFEWEHKRKNGEVFPVEVSLTRIPLEEGAALFCVWRDITVQKHTEHKMIVATEAAERASQAKSEFLATMSHEFRTPLNAILGFSEMLRAQYFGPLGSESYQDYANDIHNSGAHMLTLINDILDIAAIEAGKRVMEKETIALDQMLTACVRNVEPAAADRNIDLSLDIPNDLPSLYADRRSVTQIVLNLLSNAIKFNNHEGEITLSAAASARTISIKVMDTGIGIPSESLPSITDAFSQGHSDPHMAQSGTGLGLSIVNSLVDAHDGKLQIESEVGKGTTVSVVFPLVETQSVSRL